MNEAKNPIIGHIDCPLCGNSKATVHRNSKGKKLYYRCYPAGKDGCWTIQPHGEDGQKFIRDQMRPLSHEEQDEAATAAAADAKAEAENAARKARREQTKKPATPQEAGAQQQTEPPPPRPAEQKPKSKGFLGALFAEEGDE